jgi:nucleoside-diphosphate-sugar epimerase
MRTAIVTGVDGFLGSAVARHLSSGGTPVIGVARRLADSTIDGVHRIISQFDDPQPLTDALRRASCPTDAVAFHMVGLASVPDCERVPLDAVRANVTTVAVLLEALRSLGLRRVVFPSTGLVYGSHSRSPVSEDARTDPSSVYAATKLAGETLLQGYASTFGFASVVGRLSTVYGADASPETVVGRLLAQAREGQALRVRTARPVRDFIYVDDVVEALLALADSLESPGCVVYNVSSGVAISVGELARTVATEAGLSSEIEETEPDSPGTAPGLVLSNSRLRQATGWQPRYTLQAGVAAALQHYEHQT